MRKRRIIPVGEVYAVDAVEPDLDRLTYGPGDLQLLNEGDRAKAPLLPMPSAPFDPYYEPVIDEADAKAAVTMHVYEDGSVAPG